MHNHMSCASAQDTHQYGTPSHGSDEICSVLSLVLNCAVSGHHMWAVRLATPNNSTKNMTTF